VSKPYHPKAFSVPSAIAYAIEHASGYNVDAVGPARAALGNPEGAARLCRWAITKHVDKARPCPACELRASDCACGFTQFAHDLRVSVQDPRPMPEQKRTFVWGRADW
jgi:hypothetical protein